jgi:hypothetical protein
MKKALLILVAASMLFVGGCSKEWLAHDTVYKTNDHMAFSLWGYKDADRGDLATQESQGGWWGEPITVE